MGSMSWMGITRFARLGILIICGRYYTFCLSENQFVFIICPARTICVGKPHSLIRQYE